MKDRRKTPEEELLPSYGDRTNGNYKTVDNGYLTTGVSF